MKQTNWTKAIACNRACLRSLLIVMVCLPTITHADSDVGDTTPAVDSAEKKDWSFVLGAYGFLPWVTGQSGAGSATADLHLTGTSQIWNSLRFAAAFDAEAIYKNRYSFGLDFFYANLGTSQHGRAITNRIAFSETIIEARAGYRFFQNRGSWLEAYAGARYWDVKASLSVTGPLGGVTSGAAGDQWIDPLIGLRGRYAITPNWALLSQADIGGFGLNSDMSWRTQAAIEYVWENGFGLSVGYKALQTDFDNGKTGSDRFVWDV